MTIASLTDGCPSEKSKTIGDRTTVLVLALILDEVTLRWGVIASVNAEEAVEAYQSDSHRNPGSSNKSLDVVAIIISIASLVVVSMVSCITWRQRAYSRVN